MGFISDLFVGTAASSATKVLGGVGSLAKDIRTAIKGYELTPEARAEIEGKLADLDATIVESQSSIIVAEAKGGWLQRNWRPLLMCLFGFIIFNNYVLFPYLSLFTEGAIKLVIPPDMWALMKLGMGGYVITRGGEKMIKEYKKVD